MQAGRESERVGLVFCPFGRSFSCECGVRVGIFIDFLPVSAAVLLVGMPAGKEGERTGHFILCFRRLMFTDWVGKGESVPVTFHSQLRRFW